MIQSGRERKSVPELAVAQAEMKVRKANAEKKKVAGSSTKMLKERANKNLRTRKNLCIGNASDRRV